MDRWNKSTTDFVNWILKEETHMSMTAKYLNGTDYISATKTVCFTKKEFDWMWGKIYS